MTLVLVSMYDVHNAMALRYLGSGIRIYFLLIRLTYIFAKGNDNPYFKPKNDDEERYFLKLIRTTKLGYFGGFQLEFVSISRVINHMTSYNSSTLIG